MLKLGRRPGEEIIIGEGDDKIVIRVFEVNGNQVCIGIDAPKHISVHREEIYRRIQAERDGK